jgi:hypothetical protein
VVNNSAVLLGILPGSTAFYWLRAEINANPTGTNCRIAGSAN